MPGTTNGPSAVRCVSLGNGATLSGFTLTNGATPTAGYGGGVDCQSTNCLVTNCVIVGNAAPYAAGAFGGTLINCIIDGNTAGYTGGGAQQCILLDCVLSNNAASGLGSGGGAYNSTLIDCLLTGNQSGYRGGAAYGCNLTSCTIAGNTGQPTSIEHCTLTNCICYYNSPDNSSTGQGNNYFNNGCTTPLPGSGVNTITNPPAFVDLAGGDFHLSPASPCINAGNNSYTNNSTDLDGNPRIVGGTVDIGAYEFQAPDSVVFNAYLPAPTNNSSGITISGRV